MCGIAGLWSKTDNQPVSEKAVQEMISTLKHRGPNAHGVDRMSSITFGHTRLSILDLSSSGNQPMKTPDGRCAITFNGEIYNYRELREQYLHDIPLVSQGDSEVLLHLLATLPFEKVMKEIRGMFAFAFWDETTQKLTLARDPFGKKPLFYTETKDLIAFASEPKALLQLQHVHAGIDAKATTKYFLYEYPPSPASGFANIRQIQMGEGKVFSPNRVRTFSHWKPTYTPKLTLTEAQAARQLDNLLHAAVQRRLIADVPVGLFLSGGLDSTAIGWYMKQASTTAESLHSFSASFREKTFDESEFAQMAADALGFSHHEIACTAADVIPLISKLIPLLDTPLADASLLPTYQVSELARQYVTVVLDGDGSDELLYGYGTFQAAYFADKIRWMPRGAELLLEKIASKLPTHHTYFSLDFKIKSFFRGLSYPIAQRNQIWLGSFSDKELKNLLTPTWKAHLSSLFEDIDHHQAHVRKLNYADAVSYMTVEHYLHNDILVKLDRATMYNSIEARTPFLDIDLATFVMQLPPHLKKGKYLLKKIMRGRIPDEIIDRPKKGFGIPIGKWLQEELSSWAQTILSEEKIKEDGVLQYEYVSEILSKHQQGKADNRKKIWTLLMFQLWYDHWIAKR